MNENLKKFLEEASKNEELKAKLAALTDKETAVEKAIELAKEYGFALTAEDFQPADGAELSLDELDRVAGGANCVASSSVMCMVFGMNKVKMPYCTKCGSFWGGEGNPIGNPCPKCGTILIGKEW